MSERPRAIQSAIADLLTAMETDDEQKERHLGLLLLRGSLTDLARIADATERIAAALEDAAAETIAEGVGGQQQD